MAKKDGGSAKLVTPLYGAGGHTNGTAVGPKGGISIPDPQGKLSKK